MQTFWTIKITIYVDAIKTTQKLDKYIFIWAIYPSYLHLFIHVFICTFLHLFISVSLYASSVGSAEFNLEHDWLVWCDLRSLLLVP